MNYILINILTAILMGVFFMYLIMNDNIKKKRKLNIAIVLQISFLVLSIIIMLNPNIILEILIQYTSNGDEITSIRNGTSIYLMIIIRILTCIIFIIFSGILWIVSLDKSKYKMTRGTY